MTENEKIKRGRGASPRGDFDQAKAIAVETENARVAANKRKTAALREARLRREGEVKSVHSRSV